MDKQRHPRTHQETMYKLMVVLRSIDSAMTAMEADLATIKKMPNDSLEWRAS
jgi:hypothetical protein